MKRYIIFGFLMFVGLFLVSPNLVLAADAEKPAANKPIVAVSPINMAILRDLRMRGFLQVEINLEIQDETLRARAVALYPRLQDAYFSTLRFYTANHLELARLPDVNEIADFLQEATDNVLGTEGAHVLLSQVMLVPQ